MAPVTPQQLHKLLVEYFNLEELEKLCFNVGINYENLSGSSLDAKALSLVQYGKRHSLFEDIVDYVQNTRTQPGSETSVQKDDSSASYGTNDKPHTATNQPGNTYIFQGPVSGSAIGEGASLKAKNIAGRDITINYSEPKDKTEFADQLAQLEALLQQAIANGEIKDERDAESAVGDIHDAIEEVNHDEPRASRINRYLEGAKEVIESASKTGAAVLKAAPIISGLIKVVTTLF